MSKPQHVPARTVEVERVAQAYSAAEGGDVRIVLLEGPADAGQAHIIRNLRSRVGFDVPTMEGVCDPSRPFSAFGKVVESCLELLSRLGASTPFKSDALACGHGCHDLWSDHIGTDETAPALPDPDRRSRFFEAIRRLLAEVGRNRPPIVVLRNLERADPGTVELMSFLGDSASWDPQQAAVPLRALLLGTVEQGGPGATWEGAPLADILRLKVTSLIAVGPLDRDGVASYLSSPEVVDAVFRQSDGLPGRIDRLIATESLPFDASVKRDVAAFSPPARTLLEALAVYGRPASVDALERLAGAPVGHAARVEAVRSTLLQSVIVDGRQLHDFRDARARGLVRRSLKPNRRRALHLASAELYAAHPGGAVDAARHALRAGDQERAAELALAAWPQLLATHAYSTAAELLGALADADVSLKHDIQRQLVALYSVTGDADAALTRARALQAGEGKTVATALTIGDLLARRGELDAAESSLVEASALAMQSGDPAELAETTTALGRLALRRHQLDAAGQYAADALRHLAEVKSLPLELDARILEGVVARRRGKTDDATELLRTAAERAELADLPKHQAHALNELGVAEMFADHASAAEDAFRRSLQITSEELSEADRALPLENLAVIAHRRRDYRAAQRHYHRAAHVLRAAGSPDKLARVLFNLAELYRDLGDPHRARRLVNHAWNVTSVHRYPEVAVEGLLVEAMAALDSDETSASAEALGQASKLVERLGLTKHFELTTGLVVVALAEGRTADAQAALADVPAPTSAKEEARLAILHSDTARASGIAGRALPRAQTAVDAANRAEDPELQLQACVRLARAQYDSGDQAQARKSATRAHQIAEQLRQTVPEEHRQLWLERRAARELADVDGMIVGRRSTIPPPPPRPTPSLAQKSALARLVGSSPEMTKLKALISRLARAQATVLIRGESGTGKELVAEAVHSLSDRAAGPFVRVNCAAVAETLLSGELFGHERGAFTGAIASKKGWFELAHGGTLFLDEIGDVAPKTQAALLRVLQNREVTRLGGTETIYVDVRVIAATNRDLEAAVSDGDFRQDLYYRLGAMTVTTPPLRKHLDDLPSLCAHLLERIASETASGDQSEPRTVSPEAIQFLRSHNWPGNVRELENVLRSAVVLSESHILEPVDFNDYAEHLAGEALEIESSTATDRPLELAQAFYDEVRHGGASVYDLRKMLERETIVRAFAETDGNITKAAELLGMKRPRLSQLIKEYGIKN